MGNIKDLIKEKESKRIPTQIPLKDINKDLILSLFSISLYGKEAHDEDILSIIIGGYKNENSDKLVDEFSRKKKEYGTGMKMGKNGYYTHNNMIVLKPKNS